ncbi:MAG: hypothetical protein PHU23_09650, partial [Dehalococcoidales bacterium]|nr:hypothetical protein [Dehalococcoidales bacterium]
FLNITHLSILISAFVLNSSLFWHMVTQIRVRRETLVMALTISGKDHEIYINPFILDGLKKR